MLNNQKIIAIIAVLFYLIPFNAAADSLGQKTGFFVNSSYDVIDRNQVTATLIKSTSNLYLYVDDEWWNSLNYVRQNELDNSLTYLVSEFDKVYTTLTSVYGSEWNPGIDNDSHVTVLIHPMDDEAGGYFKNADEYSRSMAPNSNQREMIYLNSKYLETPYIKIFLAHEFQHLLDFNQKERKYSVQEDTWLEESRAEYASTLLGYDNVYKDSNLERRLHNFIDNKFDSITEWQGVNADYGALSLFAQYLVEQYGVKILADSLKSKETGIASINEALTNNGFKENFSQIFTNWTIAVLVNDCSINEKYCYKNGNLKNFHVSPLSNFLPLSGETVFATTNKTKNWAGNWYKFLGGRGVLKIEFIGNPENLFKVPFVVEDALGKKSVNFFQLNDDQQGQIFIPDFGTKNISVIILPSVQTKTFGFSDSEPSIPFFWEVSVKEKMEIPPESSNNQDIVGPDVGKSQYIQSLIEKINNLKQELEKLESQLKNMLAESKSVEPNNVSCSYFQNDLYFGLRNNEEVKCLQNFLKSQGPEIYPEGLTTGNYLEATQAAVKRYQEKYASDILNVFSLKEGTGYFGFSTRNFANKKIALDKKY